MEQVNRQELERAARRIMEMNSRAQSVVKRTVAKEENEQDSPGKQERVETTPPKIIKKGKTSPKNSIFDIINFKNMVADSDRTLLAGLMLLLGGDMADEKLMLALLYIML